jgi:hypothetical protein
MAYGSPVGDQVHVEIVPDSDGDEVLDPVLYGFGQPPRFNDPKSL